MSPNRAVPLKRTSSIVATLLIASTIACSDAAAPIVAPPPPPAPIPSFVYVADVAGYATLMRYDGGTTTQLTSGSNNTEPNSAASRLVFTSTRNVLPQVFISDLGVTKTRRVTNSSSFDMSASLSPRGDSIVFISTRSGTPRLWVINAPSLDATSFDTPVALATESKDWVPESAPAWSPLGGQIAFTSTRNGTSQVYVITSGGGTPRQLSYESGGAFQPTWSLDGKTIYFVAAVPQLVVRRISAGGGTAVTVASGPMGVGGPMSCGYGICLFSTSPEDEGGQLLALILSGSESQVIMNRTAAMERQPAILVQ
jgi:TolB protein